ncbi:MAG: YggS family pyridoxal phosphate-dependent enzyme [Deltaproteobacteria bacterium]|nr:YggS family pyridoxal phosphate-dependent enzyme [Deltaproteobacteria bacterium]MBW2048827.1 YggS family pyridoxal phosphate-dependent enzyme [Deltaproteobacteria bacterium]MBW2110144.1 YggS family pyridoxal phosphate-dependent enzyme [Deltaproteobacteria bacterium]MBW2351925.1 YggS family pyridoxal phosphate-dependent enzyme [Deltaproteobacteria bacterium]HDZ91608.1 YggS family pyridoxal phosphate-dependent enzyme [Deltaproteobacteria bacterium]
MIGENIKRILSELPEGVQLVAAAKTRSVEEIREAIQAGLTIIGHNYVQEAERSFEAIGPAAKWHMIGHLQSNKAKKAAKIFDMVETVDSLKLARTIDRACQNIGRTMPVLIEINSGEEPQKAGVMPSDSLALIREISGLVNVKVKGLMTMGPFTGDPEDARPYFRRTKSLFDEIEQAHIPGVEMKHLSMGMSNSYRVALEEGANMVRIGTRIFGERSYA